jgi:glycosyltransferase involved in cell wall biosynthesis
MTTYQFGFILEQALGHITHTKNLQQNVSADSEISAHWGLVPFEAQGLAARLPVYRSNWTVRAGLRARQAVARIVRNVQPDALFFHTQVPAVLASDWLKRIPSVVSLDATPLQYDSLGQVYAHASGPAWLEHLKWRLNRDCFRAARHIVTWSQWAKQGLIADYEVPADKITVIPPGVNASAWYRCAPRLLSSAPVRLLFVGGDFERKGGLLLLEAFRALRPLGIELHVVTKTSLPVEPDLFVYTNMSPNSDELKALYHRCDIFCLPTYGDCLPMVLSEAGAAGLPAVSTRVAGIPEIIHDHETGWLVPVGDVVALTEALRELILDPARRLQQGARAVDIVSRDFDAVQNTSRLLTLLKQMSQRKG